MRPIGYEYSDFWGAANVKSHYEFEQYLRRIIYEPQERKDFYERLLEINPILKTDTFKPYFELYSAERKTNQQDYTPDSVATILARLTRSDPDDFLNSKYAGYDATAGTGALLINKWNDDRIQETPWSYAPHRYLYRADELSDNALPYLIHNMTIRGVNCIIVHGDVLTGEAKQVYFVQNSQDDYMKFSDINVMPHSEDCEREFGITKWLEDEIDYKESKTVVAKFALPMKRKGIKSESNPFTIARRPRKITTRLDSVATNIERAKKNKIYPKGSVIIQLSATNGQVGMLKSNGKVDPKYAVIEFLDENQGAFYFYKIQTVIKKHFHRTKEGLNMTLESVMELPISEQIIPPEKLPKFNITFKETTDQLKFII